MQQTMAMLQAIQGPGNTKSDPVVQRELDWLNDKLKDIFNAVRGLLNASMNHDVRLKQLEGGKK